nr:uncharacterized protein LOC112281550 [Physcomitrium patens]|eukprot:XP_024373973.1 uncharacterized protein LOC112281550 [Physcomitrella patens]
MAGHQKPTTVPTSHLYRIHPLAPVARGIREPAEPVVEPSTSGVSARQRRRRGEALKKHRSTSTTPQQALDRASHVRPGAMAISIVLIPLYIGFLIVLCSAPLADFRVVFFAGVVWLRSRRVNLDFHPLVWTSKLEESLAVVKILAFGSSSAGLSVHDGSPAKYEASVADEFGIDEGPATFTMQDHLNFLFSTTQCRVGSLVFSGSWSTEFDQRKGIGETKDKWHGNRVNGSITSLGIRRRGRAPL